MKKISIFYLFLLVLIVIYYFYCEYKQKENMEGFLSNNQRRNLYNKYYGDFKNSDMKYGDYSNDLDLFIQATDALTDEYNTQEKPDIKPYTNIEPVLPKAPKGINMGISNANLEKYNIEPEIDMITALNGELERVSNELLRQKDQVYPDDTLINELQEEYNSIEKSIKEEEEKAE